MHRLFIDRDTWSRALGQALRDAAIPFEAHRDHFDMDAPDPEWIHKVGAAGWLAVTRDQRIRHRPNEIAAVRAAALHLFVLTSGNLSAADTGRIVVQAWPAIQRAAASQRPPAVWSVSRAAQLRLLTV
jgi:predicted nuclease of predicted toxin-antitoxin system